MHYLIMILVSITAIAAPRKEACETVESAEMKSACQEAVEQCFQFAKQWQAPKTLVDPESVMLAGLAHCVGRYGSNQESAEVNGTRLMGCNLGVFESLTFAKHVRKLVALENLKATYARSSPTGYSIPAEALTLGDCSSTNTDLAEAPTPQNGGCIGMSDLSQEQLDLIGREIESSYADITNHGSEREREALDIRKSMIPAVETEITKAKKSTESWYYNAAPLEALDREKKSFDTLRTDAVETQTTLLEFERATPNKIYILTNQTKQSNKSTLETNAQILSVMQDLRRVENDITETQARHRLATEQKNDAETKLNRLKSDANTKRLKLERIERARQ